MIILSIGLSGVYLVFLLLPGALNSLVTRFKTHFVSRVSLQVICSSVLFLLDCLSSSGNYLSQCMMDGLCKVTYNLLIYELLLLLVGFGILFIQGVYSKGPELGLISLPNLIGIVSQLVSNDWLVTVTGWEQFNLSIYLLVSMNGYSSCQGATIKYFLVSALTTTFIQLAVALLYALTGTSHYDGLTISIIMDRDKGIVNLEYLLIPLFFKLGAAPLHNWAPDLYDSLCFPLVLWIILIPKLAVLGQLMDIYDQQSNTSIGIVGIISLVGSLGLSSQWRLKRFLAYSAISNLGFILLTLGTFKLDSYLYYITIYAITLIILGTLGRSFGISGLFNLPLSLGWALSLFSLAGIPPLAGFYAKFLVLYSYLNLTLVNGGIGIIIIIFSALSAANYLSLVKVALFDLPKYLVFLCPIAVSYFVSLLTYLVTIIFQLP